MTDSAQKKAQLDSMERQRFGRTKAEIFAVKGKKCANCGSTQDLTIAHIHGGGRHATEMGMFLPQKTHNMANLKVLCRTCHGKEDGVKSSMGLGLPGNPNNPAQ